MKKKQAVISLAIIGSLGGCSDEEMQRDVYQSVEDCLRDWQYRELCEQQDEQYTDSNSSGSSSSYRSYGGGYRSYSSPEFSSVEGDYSNSSHSDNGAEGKGTTAHTDGTAHTTGGHYSGAHAAMAGAAAGGAAAYAIHRATSGGALGPTYHPDTREVRMNDGRTVKPYSNYSRNPIIVKGAAANSPNSKPVSRGGFKGFFNGKSGG